MKIIIFKIEKCKFQNWILKFCWRNLKIDNFFKKKEEKLYMMNVIYFKVNISFEVPLGKFWIAEVDNTLKYCWDKSLGIVERSYEIIEELIIEDL